MRKLVFIVTFFSYMGYYATLAIFISAGYIEQSRIITIPIKLFITLLMLFAIIKYGYPIKHNSKKRMFYILFFLFWILYFFRVFENYIFAANLSRQWYEYIYYALSSCILPFMFYSLGIMGEYKETILRAFIFSGFILGLVILYLYGSIFVLNIGRLSMLKSLTGESTLSPLALSYSGALTLFLCVFQLIKNKNQNFLIRTYLLTNIVLSFIMLFLGASRGSVVAVFISLLILFYFFDIKKKIYTVIVAIIMIPILSWGALKTGSSIFQRTGGTFEGENIGIRFELNNAGLDIFYDSPFFGKQIELVNVAGFDNIWPHNFVTEIMMSTGIIGLLLFLSILLYGLRKSLFMAKLNINYLWIPILLFQAIIQYLFSTPFYNAVLLFIPLGIIFSLFNNKYDLECDS
jgi:hypothetical protein